MTQITTRNASELSKIPHYKVFSSITRCPKRFQSLPPLLLSMQFCVHCQINSDTSECLGQTHLYSSLHHNLHLYRILSDIGAAKK